MGSPSEASSTPADPSPDATFDGRAESFDRRSAPPAEAATEIARAVHERAADGPLLDLGAGTGAFGAPLAELSRDAGRPYLGLDLSLGMLAIFRRRLAERADLPGRLLHADAGRPWPLAPGSLGTIFAARAAHLLDAESLTRQIRRVLRPEGVVLLGTVRRDPESPRSDLRRLLHRELEARGVEGRSSRRRHVELAERLSSSASSSAFSAEPEVVAEWTVRETLDEILAAWRRPGHLAGRHLAGDLRRKVLESLEQAARRRYDPDRAYRTIERFEIVRMRPREGIRRSVH